MIRKLHKEASMTQKQLAQLSGTPQSVISRIEDGKIHDPSYRVVSEIFMALESGPKKSEGSLTAIDVMNRKVLSVRPRRCGSDGKSSIVCVHCGRIATKEALIKRSGVIIVGRCCDDCLKTEKFTAIMTFYSRNE
jgi:predicted transcriptional regulator